jgi:hypothetical protein
MTLTLGASPGLGRDGSRFSTLLGAILRAAPDVQKRRSQLTKVWFFVLKPYIV